jgi:hypothetical protein
MYQWYRRAVICYVYLNDVSAGDEAAVHEALRRSQWFQRGWTLQELLAPSLCFFIDKDWSTVLGTNETLAVNLYKITGIEVFLMTRPASFNSRIGSFSVAQKMSWASSRVCTREEDVAYSLMGLLEVNMPLLYGEGGYKAFQRLQQEILRTSDDESIFAWFADGTPSSGMPGFFRNRMMLARTPLDFCSSGGINKGDWTAGRSDFIVTRKGLRVEASIDHIPLPPFMFGERVALLPFPLNCHFGSDPKNSIVIMLERVEGEHYRRFGERSAHNVQNAQENSLEALIRDWLSKDHGDKREVIYCAV